MEIDPTIITQMQLNDETLTSKFQELFTNRYFFYEIASETLPRFKLLLNQTFGRYKEYYEHAIEIYNSDFDWKAGWLTTISQQSSSTDNRHENSSSNSDSSSNGEQQLLDLPNYQGEGTPTNVNKNDISSSDSSTREYTTNNTSNRNSSETKSSRNVLDERGKVMSQLRNILLEFVERFNFCFVMAYN